MLFRSEQILIFSGHNEIGREVCIFHDPIVFSVYINFFVTPNHKVCVTKVVIVILLKCYSVVFATIEIASILYKRMFFLFQNVIHKLKEGTD